MPSSYTQLLRIELQDNGENDTTWGDKTNANFQNVVEAAIAGLATIPLSDADKTLTVNAGVPDEARNAILVVTGTLTAARSVIVPNLSKIYTVRNATTGGFPITVKTASGTGVAIVANASATVYCDGNNKVELSQSPTADGSITPVKIDPTGTYAWRFNGALGLNRAQPYVPNYGAFSLDGTTGSYVSLYQGGVQIGTMSGTADAFDFSSPGEAITFTTNGIKRVTIANAGAVTIAGALAATSLTASGAATVNSLSVTSNITAGGTVTANGFAGIKSQNVTTALGYTPVAQGTGPSQSQIHAVKIGWSTSLNRLRAAVEATDLGNIVFDNTQNVFIPVENPLGNFSFAAARSGRDPNISAPIIIRETNFGGEYSGGGDLLAPRLGFSWVGRGSASIHAYFQSGPSAAVQYHFNGESSESASYGSIHANTGVFIGAVFQNTSDERLKTKHGEITNAAKKLRKLSSFYYTNNSVARDMGLTDRSMQIGWSAQEVDKAFPELVKPAPVDTDHEGRSKTGQYYKTLMYERAVPILSAAINEHTDTLDKQAMEIQRLHDTVTVLMNRLAALENK